MSQSERRGICGICSAGCWVVAEYGMDGRITRLHPDEGSPMGMLCKLGEHAPEIIYSKDRLLYPLRRKGEKGSFDFERISWDDAYGEIVSRLEGIKREHGPESAAIYTGVGTFDLSLCDIFQPKGVAISSASSVLFPFGSPNTMGVGALCYVSYGMIAPHLTTGLMLKDMFNDMDNSEMVVVWGTNPATDLPPVEMKRIAAAHARGADIVVIDPRRTQPARLSGAEWVPVRPGTDGALALGLCNVLIGEELYDEAFVRDWTHGFKEFSQYVQHFRPEVVEGITGVGKETVVSLARRLASAKGASKLMYTGLEYSNSGVQAIRAALVLWALAGQLDVPGGRCFSMTGASFPINHSGNVANPDTGPRLGKDRFPLYIKYRDEAHAMALPDSVLEGRPYKIRSLIVQGASLLTSWPDPTLWRRTLESLEFLVSINRQLTADAAYADIVLPASTYFEARSYMTYGPVFRVRERMIEPLGESRSDYLIMAGLADRLGYGHLYPRDEEALLRHVLEGSGFTYEQVLEAGGTVAIESRMMEYRKWEKGLLRPDRDPGFDTPTGKFEIASTLLEEYGYDALPVYTEPREGPLSRPDLSGVYPLVFNSGSRSRRSFHTQHVGIEGLGRSRPEPSVLMNTEDARARGIVDGEKVRISTPRGSVVMRAKVTSDIMKGAIDANHACGGPLGPEPWQGCNINELTDMDQYDPISGFPVYKCLLCEVEKAGEGARLIIRDDEAEFSAAVSSGGPSRHVYMDSNATTMPSPEVIARMREAHEISGNASSIHSAGRAARRLVDEARRQVASALVCTARRLVFTGGGSEANNLAIKGIAFAGNGSAVRGHIITSSIEHPSVLDACRWLEARGHEVTYLPVNGEGMIDPDEAGRSIRDNTKLVSVMLANNETGTIQPIAELARIAHDAGVPVHTDAVQAFGKVPLDLETLGVDLLTVSSHKLYGPKGVGALYVRKGLELESLVHGGGQEHGLRAGTENVSGIAGFGKASEMVAGLLEKMDEVRVLRDRLEQGIVDLVPEAHLNGHRELRLPNTLNITLPGLRGESMVLALDRYGVYLSSGSACKSGSSAPSHALMAMGLPEDDAHCALRFSLGADTCEEDIAHVLDAVSRVITGAKNFVHFVPCR